MRAEVAEKERLTGLKTRHYRLASHREEGKSLTPEGVSYRAEI
jgi:hypothetical protein